MITTTPSARRIVAATLGVGLLSSAFWSPALAQDEANVAGGSITVYTSVTEDTVDAVLSALEVANPELDVEVFRAPTGELSARIATEQRTGGIGADVLWLTDPLSIQSYEAEGLLAPLDGDAFDVVPDAYKGETFVGTRLLNLVLVAGDTVEPQPTSWLDLADPAYANRVVVPDPGFAGSAFAALGYFGTSAAYGTEFYEALKANGAVQVASPVDTLTGVAEGNYDVGITLDKIARDNITKGAPITMIWPEPGAIALFSPAAVVAESDAPAAARAFQEFLVSPEAQTAIAGTGWQPVRADVEWPDEGPAVAPDWSLLYGRQEQLLDDYYAVFGD